MRLRGYVRGAAAVSAVLMLMSAGPGAQGQPPAIAPNDTLVFVIDLLRVQPGSAGSTVPGQ